MKCPVCEVALLMAERQGVEIDYCPKCRGVWMDRGELDKIVDRANAELGRAPTPALPFEGKPAYDAPHYTRHRKKTHSSFIGEIFAGLGD